MSTIEFEKNESRHICFINSETPPDKVERLKIYSYSTIYDKPTFSELCKYSYLYENTIWYTVLIWEEISVPSWKQAAVIQICDAMKGTL